MHEVDEAGRLGGGMHQRPRQRNYARAPLPDRHVNVVVVDVDDDSLRPARNDVVDRLSQLLDLPAAAAAPARLRHWIHGDTGASLHRSHRWRPHAGEGMGSIHAAILIYFDFSVKQQIGEDRVWAGQRNIIHIVQTRQDLQGYISVLKYFWMLLSLHQELNSLIKWSKGIRSNNTSRMLRIYHEDTIN